jgi:hypothetical protein
LLRVDVGMKGALSLAEIRLILDYSASKWLGVGLTKNVLYLTEFGEGLGRGIISVCSVTATGPPAIAVRRAGCDKGGRQLINWVGVGTYFGSISFLDIRRCSALILRSQSTLSSHRRLCEICIFFLLRKT